MNPFTNTVQFEKCPSGIYLQQVDDGFNVVVVLSSSALVTSRSFESAEAARNYFQAFNRRPPSEKRIKIRGKKSSWYFELLDGKRKEVVARSTSFRSRKKAEKSVAEFIELISTSALNEAIAEQDVEQLVIEDQDVKDASKYTYRLEIYPKKESDETLLTFRITNVRTERSTSFNSMDGRAIEEFISKDLPEIKQVKKEPAEDSKLSENVKSVKAKTPPKSKASFKIATLVDGRPSKIIPRQQARAAFNLQLPTGFNQPELELGIRLVQRQLQHDVPYYAFMKKVSVLQDKDLTIDLPEINHAGLYRLEISVAGETEMAYVRVA